MSIQLEDIQKSISSLTDEELIARVRELRTRRDNPPALATRAKKKATPKSLTAMFADMSANEMQAMLLKLTGDKK